MLTKGDKWESKPTIAKMQTGHTFPISTKNNIPVFWTVPRFSQKNQQILQNGNANGET